jgi:pilus assembly protein CpaF
LQSIRAKPENPGCAAARFRCESTFTTVHAGSARQALTRLRFIAQLADTSNEIPMTALNSLISEAVDIVLFAERTSAGLRVAEIIALEEQSAGTDSVTFTTTDLFRRAMPDAPLSWTGQIPSGSPACSNAKAAISANY